MHGDSWGGFVIFGVGRSRLIFIGVWSLVGDDGVGSESIVEGEWICFGFSCIVKLAV